MIGSIASARAQRQAQERSAQAAYSRAMRSLAIELAEKHGSFTTIRHRGEWFALIDGESHIPKVKRAGEKQ